MWRFITSKIMLSVMLLAGVISCRKPQHDDNTPADNFDRTALLSNIGNNIIIENYGVLKAGVDSLYDLALLFNSTADLNNLQLLRNCFVNSYQSWMHCSVFEFGPAADVGLRLSVNTFPLDTSGVNANIANGTWDFTDAGNADAIGFPALDFLLYGSSGNDNDVITAFQNSQSRKNYLLDVVTDLQNKINGTYNGWLASDGNYINSFMTSTSLSSGGSISNLVNQLNFDYEVLKNARVGIPLGKKTLNVAMPSKCEAVYSGISLSLAVEQVKAIKNIFTGTSRAGVKGKGFDDYLDDLQAQTNGTALSVAIKNKLDEIITALQNIPGPLSDAVVNNTTTVDYAYTKLMQGLVLLKTDFPSALGVLITYGDNDGD